MNKKQKVLFMAGFPRAGSTLLANILAQNTKLFPTPTSGLVGSVLGIKDNWRANDIYKSNGEEYIYPKIRTMVKNMIIGYYEEQVLAGKLPIDKNRSWAGMDDFLDEVFGCDVKIIYPIRHIGDCVISMEKMNRKSTLNNHGDNGNFLNEQTTVGRAENFVKDDGVFGQPIMKLREMMYRGHRDRIVFVPYNDMLTYPTETFNRLYDELGLPRYEHDFENIKQTLFEEDMHHGFAPQSLHSIREGKLDAPRTRDLKVFNGDFIEKMETERFKDVTNFINEISMIKGIV
jgi:sulfotransferase